MRWLLPWLILVWGTATAARAEASPPLAELEQRVHADADNAEAAYELALAYHAAYDLPHALQYYQAAQLLDPTNSLIHTSLQTALAEQRLLQGSLAQFHTTFGQARQHPAAAFNLALAAERHGLVEESIHHYHQYLVMAPDAGDADQVLVRVRAMEQAIEHRAVRISKLATKPRVLQPGDRSQVVFAYHIGGWGKRNRTGVVEQVSLLRDNVETHRFAQRSIRADNKTYKARIEILLPPDAAPGTYSLMASVIAGSRRDDQIAVFTIAPRPVKIPEPIREDALAETLVQTPTNTRPAAAPPLSWAPVPAGAPVKAAPPTPAQSAAPFLSESLPSTPAPTAAQESAPVKTTAPPPAAPSPPAPAAPPVAAVTAPPAPRESEPTPDSGSDSGATESAPATRQSAPSKTRPPSAGRTAYPKDTGA